MPIRWASAAEQPDDSSLAEINSANDSFLRAIAAFDELAVDYGEEHSEVVQHLNRLDLKLNLLFDMLSRALREQSAIPPPARVRLGAAGVEWWGEDLPEPGTRVRLDIYLHAETPRGLEAFGRVVAVDQDQAGARLARVAFEGMSDAVREGLEKLIFRHHRRSVAQRRIQRNA